MKYYGKHLIGQYTVESISIKADNFVQGLTGIKVSIKLGRDFKSIFFVTYLPTIIMNIINQATVYLDVNQFLEAIIMVNITCLMVLSALYISVSDNLPLTAEIKYVEIWLLFSLIFPFLIIICNIMLHLTKMQVDDARNKVRKIKMNEPKEKVVEIFLMNGEKILRGIAVYLNPLLYVAFSCAYFIHGTFNL